MIIVRGVSSIMTEDKSPSTSQRIAAFRIACQDCSLYQLCLPTGIQSSEVTLLDEIIQRRPPLDRGEHLFQVGHPFSAIYAVRSGSIKTYVPIDDGKEQVTGFHLPGELLGLDAINSGHHPSAAKALETTSLCKIPYDRLGELSHQLPSLQQQLLKVMSRELLHDQTLMLLLGKKSAEQRLAALLLSLSERYRQRGLSATEFNLSMSRNDIGNYLGLAVETISRLFSRFQDEGLLLAERRHITIIDIHGLQAMASGKIGS